MKTYYTNNVILQEMNNLIHSSCTQNSPQLQKFQTALIKKYFGALEVSCSNAKKEIYLKLAVKKGQYTNVTVHYNNLENFLKSCVENDSSNLSFYQNMLIFYNANAA
ncbi:hypothetical protein SAMN04488096_105250 [Mesonia phycicola]|uniref:Uncharacterized protein n=1 Tax=Mesonia phycicola TaxID=579105 RepID=A0A1M6ETD2_9FLAO|nr:hypothetical protein [Mesonia phycicola]SHI88742.1 hypothetical protein SAMN04488096_105250 [Mesonia phycicola]